MKDWDRVFIEQLFAAPNYRSFIKLFFHRDDGITKPKRLTFGEFAQRANFASKAFLNDIIAGRKRLTPTSFDKIVVGLKLNSLWTKYLKALISCEEPKFQSPGKDATHFQMQLKKLKAQIERRLSTKTLSDENINAQRILLSPDFPEIYASLGDLGIGESFEGIRRKTRFEEKMLKTALTDMVSIDVVRFDASNGHYIPQVVAIEAYGLKDTSVFKSDFFRSIEKAKHRFSKQALSKDALFMTQSFSVNSNHLEHFRKQLAELVENFAIQAEDSNGDCVSEICISFTHNLNTHPHV